MEKCFKSGGFLFKKRELRLLRLRNTYFCAPNKTNELQGPKSLSQQSAYIKNYLRKQPYYERNRYRYMFFNMSTNNRTEQFITQNKTRQPCAL